MALQAIDNLLQYLDDYDRASYANKTPIIFEITGYGKYAHALDNPSKRCVENLQKELKTKGSKALFLPNVVIGSTTIMHCSGERIVSSLKQIRANHNKKYREDEATRCAHKVVYVHLGVDDRRDGFYLEKRATNEASFPAPDELGWQPDKEPIIKANGGIDHAYLSRLDTKGIVSVLKGDTGDKRYGYNCGESYDAATFMCNYAYYWQLDWCKGNEDEYALFMHVPEYKDVKEEVQIRFLVDMVNEIARSLSK